MSAFANLPILSKLTMAFAAVLAAIFASNAIVYDRLRVIDEAKGWRIHTTDVLDRLDRAKLAILQQESSVRGYLLTGNDSFLKTYSRSKDSYAAVIGRLRELTSDNPSQQRRLDELNDLAEMWRSNIAEREIALMANPAGREDARAVESSMGGKSALEPIQAKADEIDRAERELLAQRDAAQRKAYETAYTMTVLSGTASLIIAILMAALLRRAIAVPINRLATVITALAKGDTTVDVPKMDRADEVGRVAAAVQVLKASMIERERLQSELAHANRVMTMGQLTASITHEVNQPVGAVVANAEAALRWLARPQPNLDEAQKALASIVRDGHRVSEVIQRIRALFMKSPRRADPLDINATILEVLTLTRRKMRANGVEWRVDLAEKLPLIQGDRIELQQVMLNLIINAVEAMNDVGDDTRQLLIRTSKAESAGVLVEVRDSGPELDPASLNRLFEAFYTTKPGGLGMGLSISRTIIDRHDGKLWATANEPRGAVFQFTVPAHGSAAS